ncbi:MAG: hypothetical protein OWQ59_02675 [Alicyclobacillaceae bacterium]|nr:hypothetical protein [Alicyclobacillaceae bacterium]
MDAQRSQGESLLLCLCTLPFSNEIRGVRDFPRQRWVENPETKGKVESTVSYVHRDFFYGREFTDLGSMNQQAREWCDEVNREVHSTTQEIPVDRWVTERVLQWA